MLLLFFTRCIPFYYKSTARNITTNILQTMLYLRSLDVTSTIPGIHLFLFTSVCISVFLDLGNSNLAKLSQLKVYLLAFSTLSTAKHDVPQRTEYVKEAFMPKGIFGNTLIRSLAES